MFLLGVNWYCCHSPLVLLPSYKAVPYCASGQSTTQAIDYSAFQIQKYVQHFSSGTATCLNSEQHLYKLQSYNFAVIQWFAFAKLLLFFVVVVKISSSIFIEKIS